MNQEDPYSTPNTTNSTQPVSVSGTDNQTVNLEYRFTIEHLRTAFNKYQIQTTWFWFSMVTRIIAGIMFVCLSIVFFLFTPAGITLGGLFLLVGLFLFFAHSLNAFFMIRNFRKSPQIDKIQTYRFSENGLYGKNELGESLSKWEAFTKAVTFDDGILLFQGPKLFHWLPVDSFEDSSGPDRLISLFPPNVQLVKRNT